MQGNSEANSGANKVKLVLQLTVYIEECIFEKFQDSKSTNYKTLVRRITQAIKQKEEVKSTILTCSDKQSVANFVQEFVNQRGGSG